MKSKLLCIFLILLEINISALNAVTDNSDWTVSHNISYNTLNNPETITYSLYNNRSNLAEKISSVELMATPAYSNNIYVIYNIKEYSCGPFFLRIATYKSKEKPEGVVQNFYICTRATNQIKNLNNYNSVDIDHLYNSLYFMNIYDQNNKPLIT
jgi:hypothetical protein